MNLMGALIVQMSFFLTLFDLRHSAINFRKYILFFTFDLIFMNNDHEKMPLKKPKVYETHQMTWLILQLIIEIV